MTVLDKKFSDMVQLSTKGSLILMVGQMISTFITAIGAIIIARFLGSSYYGVISIAQIPINISLLFLNNGVAAAIINFLAEKRHQNEMEALKPIIVTGFLINLLVGFFATVIVYQFAGYLSNQIFKIDELELLIKLLSVSLFAQSMVNTSLAVFAGFERMELRGALSVMLSILKTLIGPALILLGYGMVGATLGISLPLLITGILSIILVMISFRNIPSSPYSLRHYVSVFMAYSYPLFLSNLLTGGLNQIFNFILPLYVSASTIGNYSAAINFSALITFFTVPLATAFFPLFSKLKPSDGLFKPIFHNIIKYESMVVFPIACVIISLSDHMVTILYGETYNQTSLFLKITMLPFFLIGIGSSISPFLLNSQKETRVVLRSQIYYMLIGVPLGLFLIPQIGVLGLIVSQLMATLVGIIYIIIWLYKNYALSIDFISSLKILMSSIIGLILCSIIVNILDVNLWVELIIGGIIFLISYLISLPLTGSLNRRNIEDMRKLTQNNKKIYFILDRIYNILIRLSKK